MAPKRYSIYASPALDAVLDARMSDPSGEDGFRSRSSMISAIAERYAEICRREVPPLALNEWLLIFDSLNGVWMPDTAALSVNGLALQIADSCQLNGADAKWHVADCGDLVGRLAELPFAAKVAVIDAAERFWSLDVQPDGGERTENDPFAHWRKPVRDMVGRLGDEDKK